MNSKRSMPARLAMVGAIALIACMHAGLAQAAEIIKDGDTATEIRGLNLGSKTYDVKFLFNSAFDLYPLQQFDFDTIGDAQLAVSAIVNVLNADGGVLTVGESAAEADAYPNFDVPYEAFERVFNPPGEIFKPVKITFLRVAEAYTGDANQPGVWVEGGVVDGGTLFASDLYAKFTMVGEGGSGNLPPVADAGGPTYSGVVGEPVNFDGRGSTDSDGVIVDRNWFFGDGATSDGETASHTYQEPGAHNITYEVIDDRGASDTDSATAFIGASSHPPTADADGPYSGAVDAAIIFDGSGSTDRDNDIVDYDWRFGDDTSGSGKNPSHSYSKAGHYSVTLTVTDRTGDTDTDSTNAFVGIGDLPPEADAGGPYVGFMGVAKTFDGTGSRAAPGGSIETYAWDFGDGGIGSGPTPIYTYNMAGSHTVTLTVTDDSGKTDSGAATVFIGDGEPNPDDRLIDVVTLGNVGGGDEADLAVLDAVMANGDQLSSRIHVRDGGTGEEIYQVDLTGSVQSVALETVTGGAGPLLAVLQRKDNGNMQVVFLNANDGTAAGSVQYFDETWTPIDILAVRDAGGPGIAGIGVLAEKPTTGRQAIEVHTVDDLALVQRVFYFDDTWTATAAIDLGDFNGNGRSEMAVLATNNTGEHAVQTRDALSGAKISEHSFLSPINTVIGLADSADVDGNARPEVIVLGNKSTGNPAEARDVKTGALISKVNTFGGDWSGLGIRGMDDVDGNSSPEYVVMVSNSDDNATSVQVRDVPFGNLTKQTGVLGAAYDPRDIEVLADVSGNAIQEVVVAGLRPDTLSIRLQLRDALTGMKLRNIDIN